MKLGRAEVTLRKKEMEKKVKLKAPKEPISKRSNMLYDMVLVKLDEKYSCKLN